MDSSRLTIGQWIGNIIMVATAVIPGLALAGFSGGTTWSLVCWLFVSVVGGFVAGLLMAPAHRIAGAIGGMIAAPLALLAVYFYARDRRTMYKVEVVVVWLVASLPGLGVYFLLRLITDALFPAVQQAPRRSRGRIDDDEEDDDEDDEPRPRRKKRRSRDDDEEEEDDRPRSRRRKDEEDRPRRGRRSYEDD